MTDTTHRSIATFALFAYNQEQYVREAVEAALAQTHDKLEIILSDDGSTDSTFTIIQELAALYRGPHRIITRRNEVNLGTALHVQFVASIMSGDLLIVAAGDDISEPNRAAMIVRAWNEAARPSGVIHSGWSSFLDQNRNVIRTRLPRFAGQTNLDSEILVGFARSRWLPAAAPTAAYTRDLFDDFKPLLGASIIEDAPLFLRAALRGQFIGISDPLVRTRIHLSNSGTGHSMKDIGRWNRFVQSKFVAFRNMQEDLKNDTNSGRQRLIAKIERRLLAVSRNASRLVLPELRKPTMVEFMRFAYCVVVTPVVSPKFMHRLVFLARFFGIKVPSRSRQ